MADITPTNWRRRRSAGRAVEFARRRKWRAGVKRAAPLWFAICVRHRAGRHGSSGFRSLTHLRFKRLAQWDLAAGGQQAMTSRRGAADAGVYHCYLGIAAVDLRRRTSPPSTATRSDRAGGIRVVMRCGWCTSATSSTSSHPGPSVRSYLGARGLLGRQLAGGQTAISRDGELSRRPRQEPAADRRFRGLQTGQWTNLRRSDDLAAPGLLAADDAGRHADHPRVRATGNYGWQ